MQPRRRPERGARNQDHADRKQGETAEKQQPDQRALRIARGGGLRRGGVFVLAGDGRVHRDRAAAQPVQVRRRAPTT
jgi:hypothetical protein